MSWKIFHQLAMDVSSLAYVAVREGAASQASSLYSVAAELEGMAIIDPAISGRTLLVSVVSLAALHLKAGNKEVARDVALSYITDHRITPQGRIKLHETILSIN